MIHRSGWLAWAWLATAGASAGPAPVDFNRDIRPILSENCYQCHGPDQEKRQAGLRLDRKDGALGKLDSGAFALVPGHPEQSLLLQRIALPPDDNDHMPPRKTGRTLTPGQIDSLRRWVIEGAPWAEHWSYVAPQRPPFPPGQNSRWARHGIDRFVLARLEQEKLEPNPEADRASLIRRASLDAIGLPPTVQEVDAFLADRNPDAYERLVDRLLESPHFGERMALAWLDQARYADSSGYHFDGFRQMYLWRDWVIDAFNRNKPFDEFTVEQIAGDLLPRATLEQKIATGFHRNVMTTDEGGVDPEEYLTKYQVDRVHTTAQVWLGTTMGCAECHDHKYDPISTREFYQFYAFFNSLPEKGLDGTRTRNPAPVLKVPTPEQGSRLLRYLDQIPAAEKTLAEREGELPKAQEKWEKDLAPPAEPKPGGRVAGYSFEESSEAAAPAAPEAPAFTNKYQRLPTAAVLRRGAGKLGRALELRGATNEFFNAGPAVAFDRTNAFSYGAWVKLHRPRGAVLSKMEEGPGYRGFDLLIADRKAEVHLVNKFPDNAIKVVTKDPLATNVWTHLFVTYDGSNKAAGVKFYVDGVARALETPNDSLSGTFATDAPLLLGTRINAFPFAGLIDEVRFYDRALKPEEILELFAYPNLLLAKTPADRRTGEHKNELKAFFREHHATAFRAARAQLEQYQKEKKELIDAIPDTMVMEEAEKPRETFLLVRGNYQQKGEKVRPATPACWPPLPEGPTNRLALARWLASTNNPLTARVTVNRLWALVFGTGLVKTANDFGSQGDRPSHPELLDWLACEFMEPTAASAPVRRSFPPAGPHAWDVKHVMRLLLTSATYRQTAVISPDKLERDPYNRLLTRGPRLRLEAELIRDNALAISGLLHPKIGGPSMKPYQPDGLWSGTDQKYEQSHGADLYRRGLYVFWKRAAHYPSFQTFDAPSRETCTVGRPRTSTPLQSLVVMNDPVYVEAARALGARALQEGGPDRPGQLAHAFRLALARVPEPREVDVLEKTFRQQHAAFAQNQKAVEDLLGIGESPRPPGLDPVDLAAMTTVANVLLNLNETITK